MDRLKTFESKPERSSPPPRLDETPARPAPSVPGSLWSALALGGAGTAGGADTSSRAPLHLQRRADPEEQQDDPRPASDAASGSIPSPVQDLARSGGGRPLDGTTRSYFEHVFRHRFDDVRVHTGPHASAAARAVHAHAYTTGSDIVFRDAGRYDAASSEGRRLLAHELTHVVQQRHPATLPAGISEPNDPSELEAERVAASIGSHSPVAAPTSPSVEARGGGATGRIQRDTDFADAYRSRNGQVLSHLNKEYGEYKQGLGATEATSASGGTPLTEPLTRAELLQVFDGVAKDLSEQKVDADTVDRYLEKLNQSFRVMRIDTVEAQASYLANAYLESDEFRYMTETEKPGWSAKGDPARQGYQSDPTKVKLNETWLNQAAAGEIPDVGGYETGGTINPLGDWQKSFIGRGPIQATHRHYYVQTIAVLEKRAEELEQADPESKDAKDIREAVDRIKGDPRQAANPQYAFLFSAAFMKMQDDAGVRGDVKATHGQVTSWMGVQPEGIKQRKNAAYGTAYKVLKAKADAIEAKRKADAGAKTEAAPSPEAGMCAPPYEL